MVNNPPVKVGVGVFVWKDNKFLIQHRQGAHGEGTWALPGGHLEFKESWGQCAAREILEETGMQIKNAQFLAVTNDIFSDNGRHYVTIWMTSDWDKGNDQILEPDKCITQEWRTFKTLPEPLFEPCWRNLRTVRPDLFA